MYWKCSVCWEKYIKKYASQTTCTKECSREEKIAKKKEHNRNKPIIRAKKKPQNIKKPSFEQQLEKQKRRNERMRDRAIKKMKEKPIKIKKRSFQELLAKKKKWDDKMRKRSIEKLKEKLRWPKLERKAYKRYFKKYDKSLILYYYNCQKKRDAQIEEKGYWYCEHPWCTYCGNDKVYENHHIIYRSEKPGHKYLHHILNILRLCPYHHRRYHASKSRRIAIIQERNLVALFWESILCFNSSTETKTVWDSSSTESRSLSPNTLMTKS